MNDSDNDTDLVCILPIDDQQDNKQTSDIDEIQELNILFCCKKLT